MDSNLEQMVVDFVRRIHPSSIAWIDENKTMIFTSDDGVTGLVVIDLDKLRDGWESSSNRQQFIEDSLEQMMSDQPADVLSSFVSYGRSDLRLQVRSRAKMDGLLFPSAPDGGSTIVPMRILSPTLCEVVIFDDDTHVSVPTVDVLSAMGISPLEAFRTAEHNGVDVSLSVAGSKSKGWLVRSETVFAVTSLLSVGGKGFSTFNCSDDQHFVVVPVSHDHVYVALADVPGAVHNVIKAAALSNSGDVSSVPVTGSPSDGWTRLTLSDTHPARQTTEILRVGDLLYHYKNQSLGADEHLTLTAPLLADYDTLVSGWMCSQTGQALPCDVDFVLVKPEGSKWFPCRPSDVIGVAGSCFEEWGSRYPERLVTVDTPTDEQLEELRSLAVELPGR